MTLLVLSTKYWCFYNGIRKQFLELCSNCVSFCHEMCHTAVRKWLGKVIRLASLPVQGFGDQELQSLWSSQIGWVLKGRAALLWISIYLWLHKWFWNKSHGNTLAWGRTGGEERDDPFCLPRPCVPALVSAYNVFFVTAAHTWILKTKAKEFHWAFWNRLLLAFMPPKKFPFSKISLAEDQAVVYSSEKTLH